MNVDVDVAIIGGGIVGLAAALAMQQRHFSVAVIDAGSLTSDLSTVDTRVYAINQASQDLLQQLGAWQHLEQGRISPYHHMHVWDAASHASIDFNARMVAQPNLGAIIEEAVIKQALLMQIKQQQDLSLYPRHSVTAIDNFADFIQIKSEAISWKAQLLMVADGANSPCRQFLHVPLTSWPYHQHAIVATVATEKPHQQTAYQVFTANGPLAFLPLPAQQQCSIVWSTTPKHANALMALAESEFALALSQAFTYKLGQVNLQSKRQQFPLIMRHAQHYCGRHWLLLGDAAHTIHPLAGLGLNIGLADLACWLSCLAQHNYNWSKKTLSAYQRQRKYAVWQAIAVIDTLKTLFINPLPPVIALRGLGLSWCNRMLLLKRLFIEQAVGKPLR